MRLQDQVMDWDSIQFPGHPMKPKTWCEDERPSGSAGYSSANWTKRFNQDVASEDEAQSMLKHPAGFAKLPLVRSLTAHGSQNMHKNVDLRRSYTDLASQIAYRYPNPGLPRAREGAIGGTWRHIREVQGYSGSRICFIDGLVSLYDQDRFNGPPPPSARRAIHPPYAPTLSEFATSKQTTFPTLDDNTERKMRLAPTPKRKGHYQYC